MKKLNKKSCTREYSENYYRNVSNIKKNKTYSKEFDFEEFLQIVGLWFYEKSKGFFET